MCDITLWRKPDTIAGVIQNEDFLVMLTTMVDVSFHVEDPRALAEENKSHFVAISQLLLFWCRDMLHLHVFETYYRYYTFALCYVRSNMIFAIKSTSVKIVHLSYLFLLSWEI